MLKVKKNYKNYVKLKQIDILNARKQWMKKIQIPTHL